jgi:hypothetical protein
VFVLLRGGDRAESADCDWQLMGVEPWNQEARQGCLLLLSDAYLLCPIRLYATKRGERSRSLAVG